jgi:hypothetical protein
MNKKYVTCQEIFEAKLLIVEECFKSLFAICADPAHINKNSEFTQASQLLQYAIIEVFEYKEAVQLMTDLVIPKRFEKYLAKEEKED